MLLIMLVPKFTSITKATSQRQLQMPKQVLVSQDFLNGELDIHSECEIVLKWSKRALLAIFTQLEVLAALLVREPCSHLCGVNSNSMAPSISFAVQKEVWATHTYF